MQTKTSDSGIKLEVNEKILDSCTNLMRCIQILVQKSRKVQTEIIALGKGTASEKEFYKREIAFQMNAIYLTISFNL